ncbi:MAG: inorganic phosphate transporter [Candidatus Omnitrophota bacterium]|nr:inorganic phosphate transporter [Candidatus Omnitrophota bacterium]
MNLPGVILLSAIVIFFAMNMGASGVAPAFAASWGGSLIKKKQLLLLFGVFVILGAVILGKNVSLTLGGNLVPKGVIDFNVALIILFSAALSLFLANLLKIPQSTSQVTVGAIAGAGLFFQHLELKALFVRIIPMWIILPLASYGLTLFIFKSVYPPRQGNLHIYQKLFANHRKIKLSSLVSSCYVAFAIGSNNVANAVGPLHGAGLINIGSGLLLIAPLFALGASLLGAGNLETAGKEIVPLGLVSGTLVSFVTATLLIFASLLGVPQSLVQLNIASIFAVSCLKDGHRYTWDRSITQRTFFVWAITPVISCGAAYFLLQLFIKR